MLRLVYRDLFIYQKRNLIVLFAFSIFFAFNFYGNLASGLFPSMLVLAFLGFTMMSATAFIYDEASKFNNFIRATPLSAFKAVLSRYISCLISAGLGALLLLFFSLIRSIFSADIGLESIAFSVSFGEILLLMSLLFLAISIVMPVVFRFSYTPTKYVLSFLLLLVIFLGMNVGNSRISGALSSIIFSLSSSGFIFPVIFIVSAIIMFFSLKLSAFIFSKKEC